MVAGLATTSSRACGPNASRLRILGLIDESANPSLQAAKLNRTGEEKIGFAIFVLVSFVESLIEAEGAYSATRYGRECSILTLIVLRAS